MGIDEKFQLMLLKDVVKRFSYKYQKTKLSKMSFRKYWKLAGDVVCTVSSAGIK